MDFTTLRFIALDLETTGLNPNTDTIIEVAAISFTLKEENGEFSIDTKDERTMLINPDRELTEEVKMITGITNEMIEGKPSWNEVRERVEQFIGDAIIIGHNVLFDIGMLATHGIHLEDSIVLDTFELSEIFSRDAESLNLGFLSGKYGFSAGEAEHRALGDTRLSISLFLKYLGEGVGLNKKEQSILKLLEKKEEKPSIALFNEIIGIQAEEIFAPEYEKVSRKEIQQGEWKKERSEVCFSLNGNREAEIDLILEEKEKYGRIAILATGKRSQSFMKETLQNHGVSSELAIAPLRWCSLEEILYMVEQVTVWKRKETILMGKLLFWLEETQTGLLEELKFYGEERSYLRFFQTNRDEYHHFRTRYENSMEQTDCVIYDSFHGLDTPEEISFPGVIIKDIPLIEDTVRKIQSQHIHIDELSRDLREFPQTKNLLYTLYIVGDIYETVPVRPTGENQFPPGNFGETYFFSQNELWETKGKWLVLFTGLLETYFEEWKNARKIISRRDAIRAHDIDHAITTLIEYGTIRKSNIGVILHISEGGTHIRLIPRNVDTIIAGIKKRMPTPNIVSYGYGLTGEMMSRFIRKECSLLHSPKEYTKEHSTSRYLSVRELAEIDITPGTVLLTTNQKQIREIGKGLRKKGDMNVLIQGISGGKGKILSLFSENIENSVLIGLIDTWQDEFNLWKEAKSIIIIKLPFDPPSDPYFLARTVGMQDNFSYYSKPVAIRKVNTLIGRIKSVGYRGPIYCADDRLEKAIWGKEIAMELL